MAELDNAAFNAALMEYYDQSRLTDLLAGLKSPLLGMIGKGKLIGRGTPYPMAVDPGQASMSGTYGTANTNRAPADYERFMMSTPGRIFSIGGIERDVIDMAQTPKGAFKDVTTDVDAKLKFVGRELAHTFYRSENANCGKILTITEDSPAVGQSTITVEDSGDLINLGKNARLVASATAGGALHAATVYPVVSISHSNGSLVVTGTPLTTSGWAVGSFMHRDGSAANGGTAKYPSGFADWIPDDEPQAGDSWRTVDRSVAPDKLAGLRVDASTMQIREAASELGARILANGGSSDLLTLHPLRFTELEGELDSQATHEKITPRGVSRAVAATVGYNSIRIAAGSGSIRVVSDPFCPRNRGYMLDMSTWRFLEIGGKRQPRLRPMGNGNMLQQENADAVKFQAEAKGELACSNPGANGVLKFAA